MRTITIVGWYGTETVGDKAILGGILREYMQEHGQARVIVASLNPFLTRRTMKELGVPATVVPSFGARFVWACLTSDDVVMGGGPLMDLNVLSVPLWAMALARIGRGRGIVWGCGLGPLVRPKHVNAVRLILRLAAEVRLRDRASIEWARELSGRDDIMFSGDPARDYVKHRARVLRSARRAGHRTRPVALPLTPELRHEIDTRTSGRRIAAVSVTSSAPPFEANPVQGLKPETSERPVLACFLRDWPWAYRGTRSREEFERVKASFEDHLGEYIRRLCAESGCVPVLHPMHTYVEGGDDRVFARRFLAEQLADVPGARYVVEPSTVDSIITAMLDARLCICMRFHSVLFAHTARAPFLAIDYTNGGKIKGFLTDEGALDHRVALGDIARGDMANWEPIATRALRSLRA